MPGRKQVWTTISVDFIRKLLDEQATARPDSAKKWYIRWLCHAHDTDAYNAWQDLLKLPEYCKVVSVSPHLRFLANELALILESEAFPEVVEATTLPQVTVAYYGDKPSLLIDYVEVK